MDSILRSIKKLLGIEDAYTHFDSDIIMHINSVFLTLNQLGVGTDRVFQITDNSETWDEFLGDKTDQTPVQSYIYLKVRLLFDPPSTSFVINSIENQIKELEWRLNIQMERGDYKWPTS